MLLPKCCACHAHHSAGVAFFFFLPTQTHAQTAPVSTSLSRHLTRRLFVPTTLVKSLLRPCNVDHQVRVQSSDDATSNTHLVVALQNTILQFVSMITVSQSYPMTFFALARQQRCRIHGASLPSVQHPTILYVFPAPKFNIRPINS